jgi:hypothetical protein
MEPARVIEVLRHCEEELRKLAAEAASEGDYDILGRLGSTARAVSGIGHEWQSSAMSPESPAITVDASQRPRPSDIQRARGSGRIGASRRYPQFVRRGEDLVKIGWSRSDKREYQHRAGHDVLVALCQALLDSSRRRKLFTMDLLEGQLGKGTNAVPGYQGYAWLAWLRSAGLVKQHGRQGYSLIKPATFETDAERLFASLPVQEL